jgi:hypothetical protein
LDNAVIFTVSIPPLKYHEIILADYRLHHLVNNVAIHIIVFENLTASFGDLMVAN